MSTSVVFTSPLFAMINTMPFNNIKRDERQLLIDSYKAVIISDCLGWWMGCIYEDAYISRKYIVDSYLMSDNIHYTGEQILDDLTEGGYTNVVGIEDFVTETAKATFDFLMFGSGEQIAPPTAYESMFVTSLNVLLRRDGYNPAIDNRYLLEYEIENNVPPYIKPQPPEPVNKTESKQSFYLRKGR